MGFLYLWRQRMESVQTKTVRISFDGKVLLTEILDNVEIDFSDVEDNFVASMELTKGKRYVSLVVTAPYSTITKEARDATNNAKFYRDVEAQAIVVKTLASRIMGNFLIRLYKKYCPQRLFTNRDEAVKWLDFHWEKQGVRV